MTSVGQRCIGVVHGPNLNLLGTREPSIYGSETLASIDASLAALGQAEGYVIEAVQSNHEGGLIDSVQDLGSRCAGLLVNAAALTHTSIGLRDALLATGVPFVEVHLSNVYRRESFRHRSLMSDVALGVVAGFGADSYRIALMGLIRTLVVPVG